MIKDKLYDILELYSGHLLDEHGEIDLIKVRNKLLQCYPDDITYYHLEWVGEPLGVFDIIDVDTIKIVFHNDYDHVEWVLKMYNTENIILFS